MPNDAASKPASSPIVDRFHDLIKERKDELIRTISRGGGGGGGFGGGVVPNLSVEEIVRIYELVLSELTFNSKPLITDLTIIAGELREEHGEGIADAVCARILEVQADQKLPALYLLDSIVKNIGREYVQYFASRLPQVFCEVYSQVPPNLYPAMRHLFGTWSTVFPSSILHRIEAELQFSPSISRQSAGTANARASMSPRPSHGIHVNPKYLETGKQFDSSSVNSNNQQARGASTKIYAKKSAAGYNGYDSDQGDGPVSMVGTDRLAGYSGCTSFDMSAEKLFTSAVGPARSLSPAIDDFGASTSLARIVRRVSPSHGLSYGFGRLTRRGGEAGDWPKRGSFDNPLVYGLSKDHIHDRPRALIDAYGQDDGQSASIGRTQRVDPLIVNDMDNNVFARPWQNSEEEEFDWEDMSPTLVDRRSNDPATSFGSFPSGRSSDIHTSTALDPDFRSKNRVTEVPRSKLNHYVNIVEDATPMAAHGLPTPGMIYPGSEIGFRRPASLHESHLPPYPPTYAPQKELGAQFDFINNDNRYMNQSHQLFNGDEAKKPPSMRPSHVANQQAGLIPLHHPSQLHIPLQPHLPASEAQRNCFSSSLASSLMLSVSHGYPMVGHAPAQSNTLKNPVPGLRPPRPPQSISFQIHGAVAPPLHLSIRPASSQSHPCPLDSGEIPPQTTGNAFSGLISNLVSQGIISLTKQAPGRGSLGVEFDQDLLRVRHELAIQALYADLPRQCRTCGLRFKNQEEHSKHMDWHVTKNRLSRNRKQNPSRKWFVSISMWLTGTEALGADSAPGFLPTETAVEKKDDDEMAVPADEDQSTCALCGEPFEDFYSDETEEWMYKGTVYLNAPVGSMASMDRSQLGPIVHAKCRSDSTLVPPKDIGQEGGTLEEGRQWKRMKT